VLAVPLTAVHDASTDPYVVSSETAGFDRGERVPVQVLGSGDGWVRIDEESGLLEGDRIEVGP
jgi:multidrug efflux pump subunit AcrA (membrane-fusion protein)